MKTKFFQIGKYVKATVNIPHVPQGTIGQIVAMYYEKPHYYYRIVWKNVDRLYTEVYTILDAQSLFDPIKMW
jgi:hypothetical protein